MSNIPDDIMQTATKIVDRMAKYHTWKGDCVADVAQALLAERQRYDSLKALCDEMAKEARRQALGEAAAYHDDLAAQHEAENDGGHWHASQYRAHRRHAAAIRALSESSPNPLPEQIANIGKEGG